jgi:hypothetical protein
VYNVFTDSAAFPGDNAFTLKCHIYMLSFEGDSVLRYCVSIHG